MFPKDLSGCSVHEDHAQEHGTNDSIISKHMSCEYFFEYLIPIRTRKMDVSTSGSKLNFSPVASPNFDEPPLFLKNDELSNSEGKIPFGIKQNNSTNMLLGNSKNE